MMVNDMNRHNILAKHAIPNAYLISKLKTGNLNKSHTHTHRFNHIAATALHALLTLW